MHTFIPQAYPLWIIVEGEPRLVIGWRIDPEDGIDGWDSFPRPVTVFGVSCDGDFADGETYLSIEEAWRVIRGD